MSFEEIRWQLRTKLDYYLRRNYIYLIFKLIQPMHFKKSIIIGLLLATRVMLFSQEELIVNGSFEGHVPFYATVPQGWQVCDIKSTPDIQPISSDMLSHAGSTYLGLVVRVRALDTGVLDGSNEAIHQILKDSLVGGATYRLSFYLMYDPSHKPSLPLEVGAAKLQISLGDVPCGNFRKLFTTGLIDHKFWRRYDIPFVAGCNEQTLRMESLVGDDRFVLDYLMMDEISLTMVEQAPANYDCNDKEEEINFFDTSCPIYMPTAFSPNADSFNDFLTVIPSCYLLSYELIIYDRWGNKLFHSKNIDDFWDGGTNTPGAYVYQTTYEHLDDDGKPLKSVKQGTFLLVR